VTAFFVISYLFGAVATLNAFLRPASAWVEADRNRGTWLTLLILCSALGLGMIIAPIYLIGVVPRFKGDSVPADFEKR
jgi:hypothetical protein